MWNWSDAARAALAGGHDVVSRVDVLHAGRPVYTLEVTAGSVTVDATRPVRRNLSCSLVDATGALSRGDADDLLNPYECEIAPHRGLLIGGAVELAPQGVFGLTGRSVDESPEGLVIQLAGQDRAMAYQGPMVSALAISGGTPVETAVARLLSARNPGLSLDAMATGFTCGPLVYAPDVDVWAEAQKLAESVGGRLYHDRAGQAVLALAGPASDRPVAVYQEGDGLLLDVSRQEDSDTIRNVVRAENLDGTIVAFARDTDPLSPTYYKGRYGERVAVLTNQHFATVAQAQQAATARLAYELGRSETVNFTAVPEPGRDVDEVLTVHRPAAGLDQRAVIVATLDIPLAATDRMRVGCRQSRLAVDGEVLPAQQMTP